MSRVARKLVETYLSFDPRSLGLFRILLAAVLLTDLLLRALDVEAWYTDHGLIPRSIQLDDPGVVPFSLFLLASTRTQALCGMGLCALVYGLLAIGYRTRLAQLLSLVAVVSLNNRIPVLENGGNFVLNLLATWSLFLPLGRRFSLDALLASLRSRRERTPEELNDRAALHTPATPVVSLAVLALLLQFSAIYLFNYLNKTGPAWRDGSAVHYALRQERLVTAAGVWLREAAPQWALEALTDGTLALEAGAAVLILAPVWTRQLRLAAAVLLPALHLGFALCLRLGVFSYAMSAFFALLLAREHWEWLGDRCPRGRWTAYFDADCGICLKFARLVARLDPRGRVRFVSNHEPGLPAGVTRQLAERAILVEERESGRITYGADAVAELLRVRLATRPLAVVLRLAGIAAAASLAYRIVARNRSRISRRLGLAACGGAGAAAGDGAPAMRPRATAAGRARVVLREAMVLLLLVACYGDLGRNAAWPAGLRYEQPAPLRAIVGYPRLFQYWMMFSPDVPGVEQTIAVEAVTAGGRTVDPYNEIASRQARIPRLAEDHRPVPGLPARLGQDQFFAAYSERVSQEHWVRYHDPLRDWILHYPRRTGDPADEIVRFRAYHLVAPIPPPGAKEPGALQQRVFLRYPEK